MSRNLPLLMPALLVVVAPTYLSAGEWLAVRIVGRRTGTSVYTYVVPGFSQTQTNSRAACGLFGTTTLNPNGSTTVATANCSGAAASSTLSRPAMVGSYQVVGATFTLLLPDGRSVVVNCNSKRDWPTPSIRRSCRMPLVDEVEVEFSGDAAKLEWPVSLDGKKFQSETYRVLGILSPDANHSGKPADNLTESKSSTDETGSGLPGVALRESPSVQLSAAASARPMTNHDVIELKAAGFSDDFLVAKIQRSPAGYQLDTNDIVALKKSNVSELVIQAMMAATASPDSHPASLPPVRIAQSDLESSGITTARALSAVPRRKLTLTLTRARLLPSRPSRACLRS